MSGENSHAARVEAQLRMAEDTADADDTADDSTTPIAEGTAHVIDDAGTLAGLAGGAYGTVVLADGDERVRLQAADGAVCVERVDAEVTDA